MDINHLFTRFDPEAMLYSVILQLFIMLAKLLMSGPHHFTPQYLNFKMEGRGGVCKTQQVIVCCGSCLGIAKCQEYFICHISIYILCLFIHIYHNQKQTI